MEQQKLIRAIWKFPLEIKDEVAIKMPAYSIPVTVGVQDGKPMLWCIVEPEAETVMEIFYIHGTGHPINPIAKKHLGTIQLAGMVWHVFE